ncbi:hypothetical protein [Flavobacterium sp.]|jgi:hypothetical protein|uniref:hypothetical protein n=1 Tax=Flavobacterium sp. TaxID=239 RepID=UPI0037BFA659
MMKNLSILALLFLSFTSFAQENKVIIISNKYEFQKEKNTYNINNMLKAILVSNNYQVFFDDEVLPVSIAQNRCNALTGVLLDNSNLLVTKLKFQIRDCKNNLLFETAEVKTREKDYQNAYIETVRMLSPELKKYNATVIQEKDVVATPELDERLKISEFKTFLNCSFVKVGDGFSIFDVNQIQVLEMNITSSPNIFIAFKYGVNGVYTKTDKKGIFEYYFEGKYMVEEYLF